MFEQITNNSQFLATLLGIMLFYSAFMRYKKLDFYNPDTVNSIIKFIDKDGNIKEKINKADLKQINKNILIINLIVLSASCVIMIYFNLIAGFIGYAIISEIASAFYLKAYANK